MMRFPFSVHILFPFHEGPWGGGNQFLKALRSRLKDGGYYAEDQNEADVIIVNSHHMLGQAIELRRARPDLRIIHRVDGPVSMVRGADPHIDSAIIEFNRIMADGTVFQTSWSRSRNIMLGMAPPSIFSTIPNAPDSEIFFPPNPKPTLPDGGKIRVIASSWSDNPRKGVAAYQWLDRHLDVSKIDFTFVGRLKANLERLKVKGPFDSRELADELRRHHIYLSASIQEPCSNALLEAMHCGLPVIGFADGGTPELIGKGGLTFSEPHEILECIEHIRENYENYQGNVLPPSLGDVVSSYIQFIFDVLNEAPLSPKQESLNYLKRFLFDSGLITGKWFAKLHKIRKRLGASRW